MAVASCRCATTPGTRHDCQFAVRHLLNDAHTNEQTHQRGCGSSPMQRSRSCPGTRRAQACWLDVRIGESPMTLHTDTSQPQASSRTTPWHCVSPAPRSPASTCNAVSPRLFRALTSTPVSRSASNTATCAPRAAARKRGTPTTTVTRAETGAAVTNTAVERRKAENDTSPHLHAAVGHRCR